MLSVGVVQGRVQEAGWGLFLECCVSRGAFLAKGSEGGKLIGRECHFIEMSIAMTTVTMIHEPK